LAHGNKTTTVKYSIVCSEGVLGNATLTGTFTTTLPTSVAPGATFSGSGSGTIVVPASLVDLGIELLGGESFTGTVTTLNVKSSDATPKVDNAAGANGITLPATNVTEGHSATLDINGVTDGPFVAGKAGTDKITDSNSVSTVDVWSGPNGTGTLITTLAGTCSAPAKTVTLGKVTVS
jgi:hypothetical protein